MAGFGFGGTRAAGGSHAWWTGCKGFRVEPNGEGAEGKMIESLGE
jgi:hypothetical protein